MLCPEQSEHIFLGAIHFDGLFKTEIGKVDVNIQWNRFIMVNWIATDLNIWRIKIFDIDATFDPILIEKKMEQIH